jgi:hypothetical protein
VSAFERLCGLVDECWQGNRNYRLLLIPQFLVIGLWLLLFSRNNLFAEMIFWSLQVIWVAFIAWRWWVGMMEASAVQDRKYDLRGKFRLAREYWNTESATAARNRKKKSHG